VPGGRRNLFRRQEGFGLVAADDLPFAPGDPPHALHPRPWGAAEAADRHLRFAANDGIERRLPERLLGPHRHVRPHDGGARLRRGLLDEAGDGQIERERRGARAPDGDIGPESAELFLQVGERTARRGKVDDAHFVAVGLQDGRGRRQRHGRPASRPGAGLLRAAAFADVGTALGAGWIEKQDSCHDNL